MAAKSSKARTNGAQPAEHDSVLKSLSAERTALFSVLWPIVDVVGSFVGENVEIVLHDLTCPESSIVKILNGHVSGRSVGDSILSGPDGDKGFVELMRSVTEGAEETHSVISNYRTFTRSGKELQSSTVIFRDNQGTNFASLCVNADMSVVIQAHALLQSMLSRPNAPSPAREAPVGIDSLMKEIIAEAVHRFGRPVSAMDKDEKIHAVETMLERGLFSVKGGVERAAKALGVTRFTIYNYLEALRQRSANATLLPEQVKRKAARK